MRQAAFFAAAVLLSGCASSGPAGTGVFRAGAFAMDVTPEKFPISVNGGMADRQAPSSHDVLRARCLVLDDGALRIAIAVVDSCMIPRELLDEAKALASRATGIPPERMLVSATHTHTAPTVSGVFQSDPDAGYRTFLARRIAEGIAEANGRLEPGQVFHRRWLLKPGKLYVDPFGGLGIAAIPCEVFVEIGLAIKERSPLRPSFTIELANGYLPTPGRHALGGYETWRARSSHLEVDASPRFLETVLRLLGEAAR